MERKYGEMISVPGQPAKFPTYPELMDQLYLNLRQGTIELLLNTKPCVYAYSNILTPLLPYFTLVIVFAQKYVKNVGIGTLISLMLPYAIAFALVRIPMLLVWIWAGLPLGIEGPIFYE